MDITLYFFYENKKMSRFIFSFCASMHAVSLRVCRSFVNYCVFTQIASTRTILKMFPKHCKA